MIHKCKCANKGQDAIHSKGNRVFNKKARDPNKPQEYSCTVCGTVITAKVK